MLIKAASKTTSFCNTVNNIFTNVSFSWLPKKLDTETNKFDQLFLSKYCKSEYYIHLAGIANSMKQLPTVIDIKKHTLGSGMNDIIKKCGKAEYVYIENDVTIFVYHRKYNGIKARCKLHFYNGKVFLLNHNYLSVTEDEKRIIFKALGKKYAVPTEELFERKIIDQNHNVVFVTDEEPGLMVSYLASKHSGWYNGFLDEIITRQDQLHAVERMRQRQSLGIRT